MARPRKSAPQLSPGQASYVLERMVADRRVSAGEINRYVSEMQREIDHLQARLESLRQASGGSRPSRSEPVPRRGRRSARITPEQRASRKLQGRYLGLIRQIPASRRASFQKTARERGREAAIKELTAALAK